MTNATKFPIHEPIADLINALRSLIDEYPTHAVKFVGELAVMDRKSQTMALRGKSRDEVTQLLNKFRGIGDNK